jgi:hypothetical protein
VKSTKLTADTTASTSPLSLLEASFAAQKTVTSGNLRFAVTLTPTGSSIITDPIKLSVSGPFQSEGQGKLPSMDLTIAGSAQGHALQVQLIYTGGKAYVGLDGQTYAVPAAIITRLTSKLASSENAQHKRSGMDLLSRLGIDPSDWLSDPTIAGTPTLGGVATTHIHATVAVAAILTDFNKLLSGVAKSGSSTTGTFGNAAKLRHGISAADQAKIEQELGTPSFDAWIGTSDKVLRALRIGAKLPVSGQISSQLGGLTSVAIKLQYNLDDVNQPQTVTAPTSVEPFAQLLAKVKALTQSLGAGLLGSGLMPSTNSGGLTQGSGHAGSSGGSVVITPNAQS